MFFKSGHNLNQEAIKFLEKRDNITLFSAYITLAQLKKINIYNNIKEIIVRWDVQDLCIGVSDIELYDYCVAQGITLYRNTRVHLKVIWDTQDSVFFGSANITGKGIGELGKYNYELNSVNYNLAINDRLYLKKIINTSEIVDYELYEKLKALKEKYGSIKMEYPRLDTEERRSDFLLSQLPMSINPTFIIDGYFEKINLSNKDKDYLVHDLSLYKIDLGLDRKKMEILLKENFNHHPFILSIKKAIKDNENHSMHYGGLVKWIQDNTTTVPTPRSWELKKEKIVNILYEWICYFDNEYSWSRPNHSQVIKWTPLN